MKQPFFIFGNFSFAISWGDRYFIITDNFYKLLKAVSHERLSVTLAVATAIRSRLV